MDPNCDTISIWARREPLVEIKNGFNAWPMVSADGKVALALGYWLDSVLQPSITQAYTRSWVREISGHTAIVYMYWAPALKSLVGNLRYFVIWFENDVASWESAYGCSAFGFSRDLNRLRWAHFDWATCKKHGLGDGDAFKIKIVMDEYDLWPGNAKGKRSHISHLLMWLWMPPITREVLKGVTWGGPPNLFEDGVWEPAMEKVWAESMRVFAGF